MMSTSKVVSRGKVSEDFQPVAAVDGMLQAKRTGEVSVAQSGSVLAMEKMMHTATPDEDISSRQAEQAEIDPVLRQVLRLRGGGGNGEKDFDSIIGELRNFVAALIESPRVAGSNPVCHPTRHPAKTQALRGIEGSEVGAVKENCGLVMAAVWPQIHCLDIWQYLFSI